MQRVASLEGAPFARQPYFHVLAYAGFRKVALRLILSDDLPLSSYESVLVKLRVSKKFAKIIFNSLSYKLDRNFKLLDRIGMT